MLAKEVNLLESNTFWQHIWAGLRRAHARRPVSFYLLVLIPVALVLGVRMGNVRNDPHQFAFYLACGFVFFFAIMYRAIADFVDIGRKLFSEQESLFRTTFGDEEFLTRISGCREQEQED